MSFEFEARRKWRAFSYATALLLCGLFLSLYPSDLTCREGAEVADSSDSLVFAEKRAIIRCQRITIDDMQLGDTLEITAESFGMQIAGFDLKLGCNSRLVSVVELLPGEVLDSCGWEYFTPSRINTVDREGLPVTLWRAIGLYKISPDTTQPPCISVDGARSLLRIVVSSEHVTEIPDTNAAIFFFWENCSDNSISDESGSSLLISSGVYDYFDVNLVDGKDMLPTRQGVPRQCVRQGVANSPKRVVEFHNGGIEFKFDPGKPVVDSL